MLSLRALRKHFSLALLDRTREAPPGIHAAGRNRAGHRFNVYRNNVFVSLTEALVARFPVCHALVGDEFFRATARVFIELSPPRSPVLMTYGDDFANFIETFPPAGPVPYLGDVARLEAALTRAYHAADASPLTFDELAALAPNRWDDTHLKLHPSVQIVTSQYPVVSIWEAHTHSGESPMIDGSNGEDALVARPDLDVEVHRLPPGAATFLMALLKGASLRAAADGAAADPDFDLITTLSGILAVRIIVGIHRLGHQGL
ncbi:putative DNA-binding domain-containing protein [Microvirga sp. HBU67558]|uniref:HvfC/BufC N-terminal domain-containing protein n=1 Tax=Microvirga TaxID=186650 RepID=UPI001B36212A|nr:MULTISPECIES: DNA-binding domain-containing protein [unclassified Microvirga]MBQ0822028.1 putative DNA-binding domain-containing protein [Microvirga sp. HBU67558]